MNLPNCVQLNITDCTRSMRVSVRRKQFRRRENSKSDPLTVEEVKRLVGDSRGPYFDFEAYVRDRDNKQKPLQFDGDGVLIRDPASVERSTRRARVALVDLATLNDFDYFGTITIDNHKHNILNPVAILDKLLNWCNNYQQRFAPDFKYIIAPELGEKTKRLHFHFLFSGVAERDLFINRYRKLDFKPLKERFGHIQITKIGDTDQDRINVARYCSKYMSKDNLQIRSHRYFCSANLKRPSKFSVSFSSVAHAVAFWLAKNGIDPYAISVYGKSWGVNGENCAPLREFVTEEVKRARFKSRVWLGDLDESTPFDRPPEQIPIFDNSGGVLCHA